MKPTALKSIFFFLSSNRGRGRARGGGVGRATMVVKLDS